MLSILGVVIAFNVVIRLKFGRKLWDKFKLSVPVLGPVVSKVAIFPVYPHPWNARQQRCSDFAGADDRQGNLGQCHHWKCRFSGSRERQGR